MPAELIFGGVLVVVLLSLAAFFAWKQIRLLRSLRESQAPGNDEHRYLHRQAWRRLICSGFLAIFAGLLIGAYFLEAPFKRVLSQASGQPLDPDQKQFIQFYTVYWIVGLLILLGIITIAALDLLAIRRFGIREHRKIQADRRAMIERQVAEIRRHRNGRSPC